MTTFSVSNISSVFTATVCAYQSLVLFRLLIGCQQLHGSYECSKLFLLHVYLVCVISYRITKLWNVEST